LRAEGQPLQGNESGRGSNATLQLVLAFERRLFRTNEPENHGSIFRNLTQWFKATGTIVVVLQQETLKSSLPKNPADRTVVALGIELAQVISASQVQAEYDAGMLAHHRIVHLDG
jgi:hypothetical protein